MAGNACFGALTIDAGTVQLVDDFENATGEDCLYVQELLIADGAVLDLNGRVVYVGHWDQSAGYGGSILTNGGQILPAYMGDATFDAVVDIRDAFVMNAAWGGLDALCDFNDDGIIDEADAGLLRTHWGTDWTEVAGASPTSVPEPATLGLLLIGVWGLRRRRRSGGGASRFGR